MLWRVAPPLLAETDIIAPVPLHRWRLIKLRYNQAALLATVLCDLSKIPSCVDLLVRRRATPPQVGMSARARKRNVAGPFSVKAFYRSQIEGKRILWVDDVFTTGATVGECAKVLRRAGVAGVDVVTLGRVTRPQTLDT
jgi:ComF family protein